MGGVFVSYRSEDDPLGAAAIHEDLARRFGADLVFRDCVSMRPGDDYPKALEEALARVDVLVCVIGPRWLTLTEPDGSLRIRNERDWVRREIVGALDRGIEIIPLLLKDTPSNATMPRPDELPADIRQLALRQYGELSQRTLRADLDELAERIVELVPALVIPRLFVGTAERDAVANAPSTLLRPEYGVVPFTGRRQELADLREWAAGPAAHAVGLVTGPAGSGKTRLALELCRGLTTDGWLAGLVSGDAPATQIGRTAGLDQPLLAVVDDAELHADQLAALTEAIGDRTTARRAQARLLLINRAPSDWSTRLDQRVAELLKGVSARPTVTLRPAGDQRAQFLAARRAFATHLGRPEPDDAGSDGAAPGAVLLMASLLDVHAAALDAVLCGQASPGTAPSGAVLGGAVPLGAVPGGPAPSGPAVSGPALGRPASGGVGPLERVIAHDRRHWRARLRDDKAGHLRTDDMAAVCTVATLCAATSGEQAAAVHARLTHFLPAGSVAEYVEWFQRLYPSRHPLGPVGPDPYGELIVARTLATMPRLTSTLAACCTDDQLRTTMTILGRAMPDHLDLHAAAAELIAQDVERLVPLGMDVAGRLEDSEPFVRAMATAVDAAPPMGVLAVMNLMMRMSGPENAHLGPLRAVVFGRYQSTFTGIFESISPTTETPDALQPLRKLSNNLTDLIMNVAKSALDPQHPMPIPLQDKNGRSIFPPEVRQLFDLWQRLPKDKDS